MNIITTQYSLKYKSFEIVLAGCKGEDGQHCKGCHSPQTWDFNQGDYYQDVLPSIITKINEFSDYIEWIWVYGGEPLDQDINQLSNFLITLKEKTNKVIVLFTRFNFKKISKELRGCCDYIKCGSYIPELSTDDNIQYGIKLATSNQKIFKKHLDY